MTFNGIPLAALDFYEALEADNSKSFWTAHKSEYDQSVKSPMTALAELLEPEFGPVKLFRPYRDIRFAADKTPYKTHQGAWFEESGTYVQISASGLHLGGGHWRAEPEQIARMRAAVADDASGAALTGILDDLRAADWGIDGEKVTRVPAGFPKDHPRAELLKFKTLTAHRDLGAPDWLGTPAATGKITALLLQLGPFVSWLRRHVG